MNQQLVDRLVRATLYEGYILYPYSPSAIKNQIRWTFGGVYPRAYGEASGVEFNRVDLAIGTLNEQFARHC